MQIQQQQQISSIRGELAQLAGGLVLGGRPRRRRRRRRRVREQAVHRAHATDERERDGQDEGREQQWLVRGERAAVAREQRADHRRATPPPARWWPAGPGAGYRAAACRSAGAPPRAGPTSCSCPGNAVVGAGRRGAAAEGDGGAPSAGGASGRGVRCELRAQGLGAAARRRGGAHLAAVELGGCA